LLTALSYGAVALVRPPQPPGSVPVRSVPGADTSSGPPPGIVYLGINHLAMTGYRPPLTPALEPRDMYAFAPDPAGRLLASASGHVIDPSVPATPGTSGVDPPAGYVAVRRPWADGGRSLLLATTDRLVLWNRSTGELSPLGTGTGVAGFGGILETNAAADPSRAAAVVVVPGKQVQDSNSYPVTTSALVEYRSVGGGTRVLLTAALFRQLVGLPTADDVTLSVVVSADGGRIAISGSGLDARGNSTPGAVVVLRPDGGVTHVVRSTEGRSWYADVWSPTSPVLALIATVNDALGNLKTEALYLLDLNRADRPMEVALPLPPPTEGRGFLGSPSWSPDGGALVTGTDRAWYLVRFSPYAVSTFLQVPGNPVGWLRLPTGAR
ncbi:MAG: hypothetical protein ACR2K2_02505, partial [Mycobacteriales bacterium]